MTHHLFDQPLTMDWQKEGDEWLHHLSSALRPLGITGSTMKTSQASEGISLPHVEYRPLPEKFRSWLIIIPLDTGIYIQIACEQPLPSDELAAWTSAIRTANEQIGRARHEFSWGAIIGPLKDLEERGQTLGSPVSVGSLRLRSGGVFYTEHAELHVPSLSARHSFWSWPIIVEGRSSGYDWDTASRGALMDLHRLCGLLSVAWGRCWILREAPQMREPDTTVVPRPREATDVTESDVERKTLEVPLWATSAWELTDCVPQVADALRAHFEGLQMHYRHPSFAMLAYVASIETLGAKLYEPGRCEKCGTVIGSTERFRKALRLAVTDSDAKRLTKTVYPRRSATAHAGQLHGVENMFGWVFPGFSETITLQSPATFTSGILRDVRKASRNLLKGILCGKIPV